MIPAAAPRDAMRADDRAALAAGAAPGVADPPETVAAKGGVFFAKPYWADDDVMGHGDVNLPERVTRQCVACGVVGDVPPGEPCDVCGASPFHLIPLAPRAA